MISALLELVARCTQPEAVHDVLRPLHTSLCDFTPNNPGAAANAASILSCDHWLEWFLSFLSPVRSFPTASNTQRTTDTRPHAPPPPLVTGVYVVYCAAVQDTGATINGREPSSSSNGSPKRATHASSSTQARRAPTTGGGGAGVGRESSRQSSSVSAVDGQASAGRREALELVGEMVGCIVMSVAAPSPVPPVLLWCSCAHLDAMTRHCVGQVRLVG